MVWVAGFFVLAIFVALPLAGLFWISWKEATGKSSKFWTAFGAWQSAAAALIGFGGLIVLLVIQSWVERSTAEKLEARDANVLRQLLAGEQQLIVEELATYDVLLRGFDVEKTSEPKHNREGCEGLVKAANAAPLPDPVYFDKNVDRLGLLSLAEVQKVQRFYMYYRTILFSLKNLTSEHCAAYSGNDYLLVMKAAQAMHAINNRNAMLVPE